MSDHDAASCIAGLAGLTAGAPKPPLPPTKLAEQFGFGDPKTIDGAITYHGGCAYNGQHGYDDGYDCMGDLGEQGWKTLPNKGEWPYVVYLAWLEDGKDKPTIAEYCEGELTISTFESAAAAKAYYDSLTDCP